MVLGDKFGETPNYDAMGEKYGGIDNLVRLSPNLVMKLVTN